MLQDTHIHIQDIKDGAAISSFLEVARKNGVACFFGCAITPADWPLVEGLAERYPGFIPFFGIHPWFSDMPPAGWEEDLKALLAKHPHAGVGETGLDKSRKNIGLDVQQDIFSRHLHIAWEYNRPFSLHCVRAWPEAIALIEKEARGTAFSAHSFHGTKEDLLRIIAMNGYPGFSAKQLLRVDDLLRELITLAPVERILIETDFPYQTKWTSPEEYVRTLEMAYRAIGEIKEIPLEQLAGIVRHNAQTLAGA